MDSISKKIPVTAVVGPTACGKTRLGVYLAKKFDGEVVSADSMQIYKGISIASAAPDADETQGVPHHMLEFLPLGETFSVADYVNQAQNVIDGIISRNKLPVLVGGTGLYVNSLIDGIKFSQQNADDGLRKRIEEQTDRLGTEEMLRRLAVFDPDTAQKLHTNDKRRIIRAFEVYEATGIPISVQNKESKKDGSRYSALIIGLTYRNRETLYERIEKRIDEMLKRGLLEEAAKTLECTAGKGALQAIGHKEMHAYLRGEVTYEQAVSNLKTATRHYAKRQLTWFNKRNDIFWIYADECDADSTAYEIVKRWRDEWKNQTNCL